MTKNQHTKKKAFNSKTHKSTKSTKSTKSSKSSKSTKSSKSSKVRVKHNRNRDTDNNKDKKHNITLYKNYNNTRLLLLPPRNDIKTASLYFYFKVGSKNEPPEINGISHFIEHMIYKGSPKFKKYSDITPVFDINGISFNAYTTKDVTAYHYKFLSTKDNVDLICKITSDIIFNPFMRPADIITERNVIIQELKDGEDEIDDYINDTIENIIYDGHPLAQKIIGSIKTLDNIKQEQLLNFHKKYYSYDNLLIAFSGNIKPTYINIINKYFSIPKHASGSRTRTRSRSRTSNTDFKPYNINTQSMTTITPYIEKHLHSTVACYPKELKQDYVHIIFKTKGEFDSNYYNYKLLGNILGGNMSSRLFIAIREKLGLVYTIKCSISNSEEVGMFIIETQNENKDTVKCIKAILLELDKIKNQKQYTITEQELISTKKNYCDLLITNFDDIEIENEFYSYQLLYNKPFKTIDEYINSINAVTLADLQNTINDIFDFTKMHIITFGKITEKKLKQFIN